MDDRTEETLETIAEFYPELLEEDNPSLTFLKDYLYCDPQETKLLIGPISATTMYSPITNKRIIIFGDLHERYGMCGANKEGKMTNVEDYISCLLTKHASKPIDMFIEDWDLSNIDNYLTDVTKTFRYNRKIGDYPNLRYHITDIRDKPILQKITEMVYNNTLASLDEDDFRFFLYSHNIPIVITMEFVKYLFEDLKIDKQLKNIRNIGIRVNLEDFYLDSLETEINSENDLIEKYRNVGVLLMDFYLLARMFRSFSDYKEPSYCIVYVGNDHATDIIECLKYCGFIIHDRATSEEYSLGDVQCIDISSFEDIFDENISREKDDDYEYFDEKPDY